MFFCIGAQKAATTWLYDQLQAHPQVHLSLPKEMHYFDVRAGKGEFFVNGRNQSLRKLARKVVKEAPAPSEATLRQLQRMVDLVDMYDAPKNKGGVNRHRAYLKYLMDGWQGQKIVGDITPAYAILNRNHFADMASIGEARFLFILRDPVARMWSGVRMEISATRPEATPEEYSQACIARGRELIESGRLLGIGRADYRHTITELEAAVPTERRLFVFFEDMFDGDAPARICDFLKISRLNPDVSKRVNEGMRVPMPPDIQSGLREAFAPQYDFVRAHFGDRVPAAWRP
jgi:hypothetical protein